MREAFDEEGVCNCLKLAKFSCSAVVFAFLVFYQRIVLNNNKTTLSFWNSEEERVESSNYRLTPQGRIAMVMHLSIIGQSRELGFQLDILLFFNYRSSCLSVVQLSPSVYLSSTFNHHSPLFLVGLQIVCILNDWRSALKYMWFTSFFSDMNRVDFVVDLGTSVLTWCPSV